MNKRSGITDSFAKVWKRVGFYIVLFSCMMIVGATGYITKTRLDNARLQKEYERSLASSQVTLAPTEEPTLPVTAVENPKPLVTATPESKVVKNTSVPSVATAQSRTSSTATAAPTPVPTSTSPQQTEATTPVFFPPLGGEVMVPFAKDELIFSKTLGDWRTHNGIDIKGELGAKVFASGDGRIADSYEDSEMGLTIVIDHEGGYQSVYSNLSTIDLVTKGQEVKAGDLLSAIGDTALNESGEEAHLHFEIKLNGNQINPEELINR